MNSYKKEEFGFDFVGTLQENWIHCPQRSRSSPPLVEILGDFKTCQLLVVVGRGKKGREEAEIKLQMFTIK